MNLSTPIRRPDRIVFALVLALLLAVTSAGLAHDTLLFDQGMSNVDYTDDEIDEVYPAFAFADGTLWVSFHEVAVGTPLPAIAFEVPDLEREDFFGEEIGAVLGDIGEVTWRADGPDTVDAARLTGVTYTHTDASLDEAVAAYVSAFEAIGFDVEVSDTPAGSMKVALVTNGSAQARIALRTTGNGEVTVDVDVL